MTIWLSWMDADDAEFRNEYESLTGEAVQASPNHKDGQNLIGSSVCTKAQADSLAVLIPSVVVYPEYPAYFQQDDLII